MGVRPTPTRRPTSRVTARRCGSSTVARALLPRATSPSTAWAVAGRQRLRRRGCCDIVWWRWRAAAVLRPQTTVMRVAGRSAPPPELLVCCPSRMVTLLLPPSSPRPLRRLLPVFKIEMQRHACQTSRATVEDRSDACNALAGGFSGSLRQTGQTAPPLTAHARSGPKSHKRLGATV